MLFDLNYDMNFIKQPNGYVIKKIAGKRWKHKKQKWSEEGKVNLLYRQLYSHCEFKKYQQQRIHFIHFQ